MGPLNLLARFFKIQAGPYVKDVETFIKLKIHMLNVACCLQIALSVGFKTSAHSPASIKLLLM